MNLNARITLAIRNFFRKHGTQILAVLVIWLILFIINQHLKNQPKIEKVDNSYNPDKAIMDDNGNVPNRYRTEVKETIDNFFGYCKIKNYDSAYNLLTTDCKEKVYENSIERFKQYVNSVFNSTKTYYIQNYSNVDNIYIYDLYVMDDIESTGGTGGYDEYKEKIALMKEDGTFKIANQGYVGNKKFDITSEDQNVKLRITSKDMSYSKESYNVTFTNKTDKYILISDGSYIDAVTLNLGDQKRNAVNTSSTTFLLSPNSTKEFTFMFDKFVDDGRNPTEINFNVVSIFDNYNTTLTTQQSEKLYSINVPLK